ncbi:hypothetical protein LINPERPRIM_LOCUS22517 [Linum perenne]
MVLWSSEGHILDLEFYA